MQITAVDTSIRGDWLAFRFAFHAPGFHSEERDVLGVASMPTHNEIRHLVAGIGDKANFHLMTTTSNARLFVHGIPNCCLFL